MPRAHGPPPRPAQAPPLPPQAGRQLDRIRRQWPLARATAESIVLSIHPYEVERGSSPCPALMPHKVAHVACPTPAAGTLHIAREGSASAENTSDCWQSGKTDKGVAALRGERREVWRDSTRGPTQHSVHPRQRMCRSAADPRVRARRRRCPRILYAWPSWFDMDGQDDVAPPVSDVAWGDKVGGQGPTRDIWRDCREIEPGPDSC